MTTYTLPFPLGIEVKDMYTGLEGRATMFSVDSDGVIQVRIETNSNNRVASSWVDSYRVKRRFIPEYDENYNQTNNEDEFNAEDPSFTIEVDDLITFGQQYTCQATDFTGGLTELMFDPIRAWAVLEHQSDRDSFPVSRLNMPPVETVPPVPDPTTQPPGGPQEVPQGVTEEAPQEATEDIIEGDAFNLPDEEDGEPWEPGEAPAEPTAEPTTEPTTDDDKSEVPD